MARDYGNVMIHCPCGESFPRRSPNHKWCPECARERNREVNRRWHARPESKERNLERARANREQINARSRAKRAENRDASNAYQRDWRVKNRTRLAMLRRARIYGTTIEAVEALLERQDRTCPICLLPLAERFHLNHDHETGAIRGALHDACNKGIGMLADDPDRCERAATYLRGSSHAALRSVA